MAIYDYDTLAYHAKERPGTMRRSLAHVPLKQIGPAAKSSINAVGSKVTATREAISFYMLSHAMNEIGLRVDQDEPLGDMLPIVEQYHHALNTLGFRLFNYLVIITTRETRHITNNQHHQLENKHGAELVQFTTKVKSESQDALFNTQSDITLGTYLDYVLDIYNPQYVHWGSAYGGPKWGAVTQALRDFVYGDLNMEMLLDVGYTLAHNGGPIFDKGFHYNGSAHLLKVLDVQRAGQMPNLVKSKAVPLVESGHVDLLKMIEEKINGFTVDPWVNWKLVEELGALNGPYPHDQLQVEQQFGHLPEFQAQMQAVSAQAQAAQIAKAAKKAQAEKGYIEIMPGVKLKKGVMQRVKG